MATRAYDYRKDGRTIRPGWRARVKKDWVEYYLGSYPTKEEAERVERTFRAGI